jgi:hypothetical protein
MAIRRSIRSLKIIDVKLKKRAISFFRRGVDEVFAFLGHYVVYVGSFFIDVSMQPIGPVFKGQAKRR